MDFAKGNSRLFWSLFLVTMVAVSICASPFQYDSGNSGRYLMVVAKRMDTGLFPGDPVVAAIARFDSLFYRALPAVLSVPEKFEHDFFEIFVGTKIALMLSLFWLLRTLAKAPLAAVLLLAWSSLNSSALLGDVSLFSNVVTHNEIVLVLGILALVCAVRRWYWSFWTLICLALFIHSLVTIHLLACVVPAVVISEQQGRLKFLFGAVLFCTCLLCYLHWMTPPRMSPEEAGIFLRAKGDMQHISPFSQGAVNYLKFVLMLALAILGQRRWLSVEPAARLLVNFAISGAAIAFTLGFVAVLGRSLSITQVQPMRIFFWVTLFLEVVIAWAACAALIERHPLAWAFLGVIIFSMADSLWAQGLAALAIAGIGLEWISQRVWKSKQWVRWSDGALWTFAFVVIVSALSGNRAPLESLRDPWLIVLGVGLPLLVKLPDFRGAGYWLVFGLCLAAAAIGIKRGWAGVHDKDLKSGRYDWLAVCDWCRKNTAREDLFLTPPLEDNFRLHALRSCIGEEMSALAWVDPRAYETNMAMATTLRREFSNGCWDFNGLRKIAQTNGARFILVEGPFRPADRAVFTAGVYSLHELNDQKSGN